MPTPEVINNWHAGVGAKTIKAQRKKLDLHLNCLKMAEGPGQEGSNDYIIATGRASHDPMLDLFLFPQTCFLPTAFSLL